MKRMAAAGIAGLLIVGGLACGNDDDGGEVRNVGEEEGSTSGSGSGSGSSSGSASGSASAPAGEPTEGDGLYTPVSDVAPHAAIGADIAEIKAELDKAKEDQPVDWALVDTIFTEGGNSVKGDGTTRTLATLVEAPEIVALIEDAIAGEGDGEDAVRAQQVDKGISVLLHLKVLDELAAAGEKIDAGETDPAEGAPHNVDEAWAFYTADGSGLQSTAVKRGEDFDVDVDTPVLEGLVAALAAAEAGDAAAFETAAADVEAALNSIFYLATYKYLDSADDPVAAAEGATFYLAIQPTVAEASAEADEAIVAAFESGDVEAGRAALNEAAVIEALGVPADVVQD